MAKGSPFTTFTGKLGQTVGFIIKNSASKQVQGIRAYQSQVANPKSVLQSNQRLVLKPLNNVARALKPIIERGFEGVKYGAQSRQKFLSLNMSSFNGPYLIKGDERAVPGPMQITQGSLVPVVVSGSFTLDATSVANTDMFVGEGAISNTNLNNRGALSAALIAGNTDVREGDQFTFIYVVAAGGSYVYRVESFFVDSSANDGKVIAFASGGGSYLALNSLRLYKTSANNLYFAVDYNNDETLVAAAVIQSRDGETRYERSDSTLWVSDAIRSECMSAAALEAAINSYSATAGTTDWPEEKEDSGTILRQVQYTVPQEYVNNYANPYVPNVLGFLTEGGQIGLRLKVITAAGQTLYQLVDTAGNGITHVYEDTTIPLTLSSAGVEHYVTSGLWRPVLGFGDIVSA